MLLATLLLLLCLVGCEDGTGAAEATRDPLLTGGPHTDFPYGGEPTTAGASTTQPESEAPLGPATDEPNGTEPGTTKRY